MGVAHGDIGRDIGSGLGLYGARFMVSLAWAHGDIGRGIVVILNMHGLMATLGVASG